MEFNLKQTIDKINALSSLQDTEVQIAESLLNILDVIKKSKITKSSLRIKINPHKYKYNYFDVKEWAFENYPKAFIINRKRENTTYRFSLMYLIHENRDKINNITLESIGGMFGGFNHATVLHAIKNVKIWHEMDYPELEIFNEIKIKFEQEFK